MPDGQPVKTAPIDHRLFARPGALRRADAVETCRIVSPCRVTEIVCTVGKSAGLQSGPCPGGQTRAGFYDDGDIRSPGDEETEPVGLHAKARAAA